MAFAETVPPCKPPPVQTISESVNLSPRLPERATTSTSPYQQVRIRGTTSQQPQKRSYWTMADEEKKPRHRLGADELLEEVHAAVAKIIKLLESNGLAEESVEHLMSLVKGLDFMVRLRATVELWGLE